MDLFPYDGIVVGLLSVRVVRIIREVFYNVTCAYSVSTEGEFWPMSVGWQGKTLVSQMEI